MEVSLQLMNIFNRPVFDNTTYSPDGTFRSVMRSDWYGFSLSFVKRFGNSKVKGNTKTDVEKTAWPKSKFQHKFNYGTKVFL